jgi:hypothetical protein
LSLAMCQLGLWLPVTQPAPYARAM